MGKILLILVPGCTYLYIIIFENTYIFIICHRKNTNTSIVSRHLATRANNKILRTPPPHISSSEEILPRLTRRTLANSEQTNLLSSNHTYTNLMPNHIHHHCAPSVTPTHTTHIISSTAPTYAPRCHHWICGHTPLE